METNRTATLTDGMWFVDLIDLCDCDLSFALTFTVEQPIELLGIRAIDCYPF